MRLRPRHRRIYLVAFMSGLLFLSGIATAEWLAGGEGAGYAKARTPQALTTVDVSSSMVADLYPGATGDLTLRIANPNPYPVSVSGVAGSGVITSSSTACEEGGHGVTFIDQSSLALAVAANAEVTHTLPGAVHMATSSAADCAGAVFTIPVSLSGYNGTATPGDGGGDGGIVDSDGDGIADSEDCAPHYADSNPDDGVCQALTTTYDLRANPGSSDAIYDLLDVALTATTPDGASVWVQTPPGHPDYAGVENSGVRVDLAAAGGTWTAGDLVEVSGTWDGSRLTAASMVKLGTGSVLAPTTIDVSLTGWPSEFDGVLVSFLDEIVWEQTASGGFETQTGFAVDALVAGTLPTYTNGTQLSSLTGVFDADPASDPVGSLHPRSSADIVVAP